MNSGKQEIAFSNRYVYYYASLIRKIYGFVIRRGENQNEERYVGHLGQHPERREPTHGPAPAHALKPGRDGLPAEGEIILFRFRKRLLLGYCRESLGRQVSEISAQTEDDRHIRFHKTNLVYLSGIPIQSVGNKVSDYARSIRSLSQQIELKTIWEIASVPKTALTFVDIADLYWTEENIDPIRWLSLYLHLHQTCPYFIPRQDAYVPASEDEMKQRVLRQGQLKMQEDERLEFVTFL